jgi:hypothetical protein
MGDSVPCFCASDCPHHREGERCSKRVDKPFTVRRLLGNGVYSYPYRIGMCEECWQHHVKKSPDFFKSS